MLSELNIVTELSREKTHQLVANAVRWWLQQFQETDSVPHGRGTGRQNTLKKNFDQIQEAFI
jgi:hypothetical protein